MLDLECAKELCEKATPGPWTCDLNGPIRYAVNHEERHVAMVNCMKMREGDTWENEANAIFIAFARTFIPAAIERIERLERCRFALSEIYAVVNGECPSLLDVDSGEYGILDCEIETALRDAEEE